MSERPVDKIQFALDPKRKAAAQIRALINDRDASAYFDSLGGWWDRGMLTVSVEALVQSLERPGNYDIFTSSLVEYPYPSEIGLNATQVEHRQDVVRWTLSKADSEDAWAFQFHRPQVEKAVQGLVRRLEQDGG